MGSVLTAAHNRVIRRQPLSQGLIWAAVASGNRMLPLLGPEFIPQGSVTSDGLTPIGQGVRSAAGTNNVLGMKATVPPNFLPTAYATIVIGYYKTDTTNRVSAAFGTAGSTTPANSNRMGCHLPYSDGTVYFDWGGSTGANRVTKAGLGTGNFNGVWSFTSGSALRIWKDGQLLSTGSGAATRIDADLDSVWLFNGNSGGTLPSAVTGQDNAVIPFFYLYNRELTATELQQLARSPYSPVEEFRGRRTVIILNSGTGAATQTIGAATGTITLSGVTGAIAPSGSAPIGASTGTITLSGVTGAIAPAGGPTIGAATGTITLTGVNGAITSGATTIGSATGVVTLSGVAGAISPAGGPTIGAATGTITLTGVAGAISFPATSDPNGINFTFRETGHTTTFRERA